MGHGALRKLMSEKDFLQTLIELGEEQEAAEKQFDSDMDTWWNDLSKEDQMKAGSYRYVLYEVFGFEPESYGLGLQCGYMKLHNSIERDVEKFT